MGIVIGICSIRCSIRMSRVVNSGINELRKSKQTRDWVEDLKAKKGKKAILKQNYGINADKHFKNFIKWYCSRDDSKCLYVENTSLVNGIIPDAIIKTKDNSLIIVIEFDEDLNFHSSKKAYKEKWEAYNRLLTSSQESSPKLILLRICYGSKKESFDIPRIFINQSLTEYIPLTILNAPQNAIFTNTYNTGIDVFVKELLDSITECECVEDRCMILLRFRKTDTRFKNEYAETKIIHKNSIEIFKTGQDYFPSAKSKRSDNEYVLISTSMGTIQRSVIRNAFDNLLQQSVW